jgi:hypothetical protein
MKEAVLQNHSVIRNRQSNDQTPVAHTVKKGATGSARFQKHVGSNNRIKTEEKGENKNKRRRKKKNHNT